MITLTIDLEDPSEVYSPNGRYVVMTQRMLDMCDQLNRRATFFAIGRIATAAPKLIQDIAARGHEIAYHSHNHVPLTQEGPARFRTEGKEDKDKLEQLAGKPVIGYRAPRFSLTPKSKWVVDALGELGFRYSSSVMSTKASLFGYPSAPQAPFRWPNGLIELPLPIAKCGPAAIPYLGGIYLYSLPSGLTNKWATKADAKQILWTYAHPYDFDREEKFGLMPNTPPWVSCVLYMARRVAEKKVRNIMAANDAPPLGERLPTYELTTFTG